MRKKKRSGPVKKYKPAARGRPMKGRKSGRGAVKCFLALALLAACAAPKDALSTTRVGVFGGSSYGGEGSQRGLQGLTVSVAPFGRPESPLAAENDRLREALLEARREVACAPVLEVTGEQDDMGACEEEVASLRQSLSLARQDATYWEGLWRLQVEHGPACGEEEKSCEDEGDRPLIWWMDAEFLAWLSGLAALILAYAFRRPMGAMVRKAVGRGDVSQ